MRRRRRGLHRLTVRVRAYGRGFNWPLGSVVDRHDRRIIRSSVESGVSDANSDGNPHSDRDTNAYGDADSDAHPRSD